MTLGRSVSSAKCSGDALNERHTGAGSSGVAANIFPPTLNSKSLPHRICSVAPGKERQTSRSQSTFMSKILGQREGLLQSTRRHLPPTCSRVILPKRLESRRKNTLRGPSGSEFYGRRRLRDCNLFAAGKPRRAGNVPPEIERSRSRFLLFEYALNSKQRGSLP